MSLGLGIILIALAYIGALFVIAHWGDRAGRRLRASGGLGGVIYPLSLAVYCTSWTFFGSVGFASRSGFDFLAIYVGPILMFALGWPLLLRIVRIAKAQNITSVADFIGARYGKSQPVAAMVVLIVVLGTVPYLALQLKAVSASLMASLTPEELANITRQLPFFGDLALLVAAAMAVFAMLFGTRHADATEHQEGLMLAVAVESIVKLVCFLSIGLYITWGLFGGLGDLIARAGERADIVAATWRLPDAATFFAMSLLSFMMAILLPRMFHVAVVENRTEAEVRRAAWLFPAYLVAINLFVLPIAVAGLLLLPAGSYDSDMTVVVLPLAQGHAAMTLLAIIGGLSAATAMVMVACVALSIMISNDVVIPTLLKLRGRINAPAAGNDDRTDLGPTILRMRRTIILVVMIAAYFYYRLAGDAQLASIGLMSFAAVAQLAPALFLGLFWRRATARAALAGMGVGILVWSYTLLMPMLVATGALGTSILQDGLFGLAFLRPQNMFGLDLPPLAHGVFLSLSLNLLAVVAVSLWRQPTQIEVLQADLFVPAAQDRAKPSFRLFRSSITVGEVIQTVARYLGPQRTQAAFDIHARERGLLLAPDDEADIDTLRHAERLLASAIGSASSRMVMSLLLKRRAVTPAEALRVLDDATAAVVNNREMLKAALEHSGQGVMVVDGDGRLMDWNRPLETVLALPAATLEVGMRFEDVIQSLARRGEFGAGEAAELAAKLARAMLDPDEPHVERLGVARRVIETRAARLPDAGIVVTVTDVTAAVDAAEDLERANETLEARVRERTEELMRLNGALAAAKAAADEANLSKTRFLAAASHDLLQPLNAARLYATSLVEKTETPDEAMLARNLDASLEAVEDILGTLLDISRLDAGAMKPEWSVFRLDDLFRQLAVEFAPIARQKGLDLTFCPSSVSVRSDRRLLRRALQNLVSNAIKYTDKGRVLVGVRRKGAAANLEVWDTGGGIPQSKQKLIFREFQRLEQGARQARGLGLGLSIVERIARVLDHPLALRSRVGKGSVFSLALPVAAAVPSVASAPAAPSASTLGLSGLVVLAIDNEPAILDGMRALLNGWGATVVTAADFQEATDALQKSRLVPDVLVIDYHLDEANGIDVAVQLRWRLSADLPIVLVTAERSPEVRERAAEKSIHLLPKPLKPAALRALLSRFRLSRQAAE